MSWDVTAYRFADYPLQHDTDTRDLERLPLGTVAEVRDKISRQLPDTEWEANWTGYYPGEGFRLEFFVGSFDSEDDDVIDNLDFSVYGEIDEVISILLALAKPYQWTLQELSEGQLILPGE